MNDQRRPAPKRIASSISPVLATPSLTVQGLSPQRFKQSVGNEARHFLAHMQRAHAQGGVDGLGRLDGFGAVCWPPTISTKGSRYTGLNGWPTTQRSGCVADS